MSVTGTLAGTVGMHNPFRYRGYIYDAETGFYYLQSRYYDPETGRFVNAENTYAIANQGVIGYNAFAYCANNPVNVIKVFNSNVQAQYSSLRKNKCIEGVAADSSIYLDVPLYHQNGYNLCWAFCQIMVEDFYANRYRSGEEATASAIELAIKFHNASGIEDSFTWNQGGWPTNTRDAFLPTGINDINNLYEALVRNGPIYGLYNGKDGAHLIVVTGVNLSKNIVYTNNPWGIFGGQTYEQFLHGFIGLPDSWDMTFDIYIFSKRGD